MTKKDMELMVETAQNAIKIICKTDRYNNAEYLENNTVANLNILISLIRVNEDLIAAAPELLDACEGVLAEIGLKGIAPDPIPFIKAVVAKVDKEPHNDY